MTVNNYQLPELTKYYQIASQ